MSFQNFKNDLVIILRDRMNISYGGMKKKYVLAEYNILDSGLDY